MSYEAEAVVKEEIISSLSKGCLQYKPNIVLGSIVFWINQRDVVRPADINIAPEWLDTQLSNVIILGRSDEKGNVKGQFLSGKVENSGNYSIEWIDPKLTCAKIFVDYAYTFEVPD